MSQTDPIAEFLTRIRNAMHARHRQVEVAHSRLREAISRALLGEGFLDGVEVTGGQPKRTLTLKLRYSDKQEPVIRGLKRVSRLSLRRYTGAAKMPNVRGGLGVQILSTPLGVMTDREARRKRVGGEILMAVW